MHRNKTRYDLALEQGRAEGMRRGRLEFLEILLESRFGPPTPETLAAMRALPDDKLRQLRDALFKATSLADLNLFADTPILVTAPTATTAR